MVLDYRTVSTMHARMTYQNPDPILGATGGFILQDLHSSNGSLLYLQRPHFLGNVGSRTILRLGRTTMSLDLRGNAIGGGAFGIEMLPSCFSCQTIDNAVGPCSASPEELYTIMSHSTSNCSNTSSPVKAITSAGIIGGENSAVETDINGNIVDPGFGSDSHHGVTDTRPDGGANWNETGGRSETANVASTRETEIAVTRTALTIVANSFYHGTQAGGMHFSHNSEIIGARKEDDNATSVIPNRAGFFHSSAVDFVAGAVSAAVVAAVTSVEVEKESAAKASEKA